MSIFIDKHELVTKSDLDSYVLLWSDNLISDTNINVSSADNPGFPQWSKRALFTFNEPGTYKLDLSATNNTGTARCGFRVWKAYNDTSIIYNIHFDADGKSHEFELDISANDIGKVLTLYAGNFSDPNGFTTTIITSYKNISLCKATPIIDEISAIKSELEKLKK